MGPWCLSHVRTQGATDLVPFISPPNTFVADKVGCSSEAASGHVRWYAVVGGDPSPETDDARGTAHVEDINYDASDTMSCTGWQFDGTLLDGTLRPIRSHDVGDLVGSAPPTCRSAPRREPAGAFASDLEGGTTTFRSRWGGSDVS
ncbi:MAG TPA: hypothetical protein VMD28_06060 [Acidimicrobiales bacterium]|nr:hypothetical protein [Acidimicrobiales bacterium]